MSYFSTIRFLEGRKKLFQGKNLVFILSIVIGIIAGFAAVLLKTSVHYIEHFLRNTSEIEEQDWLYLGIPLVGILITVLYIKFFVKDDIGHGVSKVLYAISKRYSKIKKHNMYSSIVACTFTGGFGGSVGMEAPILYTGAAIGSNIGQIFNLPYKTLTLLIGCGVAGAMSAIFKAPIAGMIFALEVLMLDLTAFSIIPLLTTTVTGAIVSMLLLGEKIEFYFTIRDPVNYKNIPFYILLGIFTGFISLYFVRMNSFIEKIFNEFHNPLKKAIFGGIAVSILIFLFPPLYGEGYTAMKSILSGNTQELFNNSLFYSYSNDFIYFLLFLLALIFFKVIAMSATTGSGGIGGVFAPSLFVGGVTGFAFSKFLNTLSISWINLSESNFTLVGMAGLIAGVVYAPLTAIFLIAEITGGYQLFIPLIITSSISFITMRFFEKYSIYTKKLAQQGNLITHDKDKAVLSFLKIEDVLETNFLVVKENATLGELVKIIAHSKRNIFPVINNEDKFSGYVLLDDVREIMFDNEKYNEVFVKDIMMQPPDIVAMDDNMEQVMQKFKDQSIWNLPVIDNGKYIGFISRSNLFNIYRKKLLEFFADN
ncbi:MAG TPA: chloride channel protein [Bacteroidales bacterium]|nr:chloride channel protein [Bacteroidales bacterium]HPS15623.1 chloride channel protein [Bacteroidales bacterium]